MFNKLYIEKIYCELKEMPISRPTDDFSPEAMHPIENDSHSLCLIFLVYGGSRVKCVIQVAQLL